MPADGPVRARRTRVTAIVVVAALVGTTLLGALASFGGGGRPTVDIPAEGPWTVLVGGDLMSVAQCAQDPAVADAYVGADDPAAGGGVVLAEGAQVADVQRVVTCIAQGVDPARITVITTPEDQRAA